MESSEFAYVITCHYCVSIYRRDGSISPLKTIRHAYFDAKCPLNFAIRMSDSGIGVYDRSLTTIEINYPQVAQPQPWLISITCSALRPTEIIVLQCHYT